MADLLTTLQRVLQDEREVFGDFLLLEPRTPRHASQRTPAHPPASAPADATGDLFGTTPRPPERISGEAWADAATMEALDAQIHDCLKCPLGETRTKFVFGTGNPHATLMFVGEAPGADEDLQGEPFVGRAGQLLNKILAAISMQRSDVYICNILKCRPPNNRTPQPGEVDHCMPYLRKQIQLVKPKLIVCLGLTAAQNLLRTSESLGRLRGRVLEFEGTPLMVTYHPAALLRNPNWKAPAWEDFQAIQRLHARHTGAAPGSEEVRHG
jgi:DNA polymerase